MNFVVVCLFVCSMDKIAYEKQHVFGTNWCCVRNDTIFILEQSDPFKSIAKIKTIFLAHENMNYARIQQSDNIYLHCVFKAALFYNTILSLVKRMRHGMRCIIGEEIILFCLIFMLGFRLQWLQNIITAALWTFKSLHWEIDNLDCW